MPKVSICVPLYNAEKYLEKSATSVFNQTLDDLEFVFVDDSSTDSSVALLNKVIDRYPALGNRVKLITHSKNKGPGEARKTALMAATGDYVYFPDADDFLESQMMELMYEAAICQHADIVVCQVDVLTPDGTQFLENEVTSYTDREWLDHLFQGKAIALWWRMMRRELVLKSIEGETFNGLIRFEDYLLTLKCHYHAKHVVGISQVLYHKNQMNDKSLTHTISLAAVESAERVGKRISEFAKQVSIYDKYKVSIDTFRYFGVYPYAFSVEYWNPQKWRETIIDVNLCNVEMSKSIGRRLFQNIVAKLLVSKHDKMAYKLITTCKYLEKVKLQTQ